MKNTMTFAEWKQLLRTRKMIVPMIAILFIPVLYAGMFLWAFWDPYDHMDQLPVAVVNLDEGADFNEEKLTLGDELADKLVESKQFDFQNVTKERADEGLKGQDYYITIEIPENFSEHATTLLDENPQKLNLLYKPNEGFNFLSGQIGETAMDRIKAEVNEQIASTYAEQLFDSITEMGEGFGDAADGAGKLHDGAIKLADGTGDLKGYLAQLASSSVALSDGSTKLAEGANKAAKGANDLSKGLGTLSAGANDLQTGADQAAAGSASLQAGISEYTAGVDKLASSYAQIGAKEQEFAGGIGNLAEKSGGLKNAADQLAAGSQGVNAGINKLSEQLGPILAQLPDEQKGALQAALGELKQGSAQVAGGLGELSSGAGALQQGAAQLNGAAGQLQGAHAEALAGLKKLQGNSVKLVEGSNALASGNSQLAAGSKQLVGGVQTAAAGSKDLANGLNELTAGAGTMKQGTGTLVSKSKDLAAGSEKLASGATELNEGTATLQEKLAEAKETASEVKPTDKTYEMAASPVEVQQESINKVPNYGTGFAPYFLSLGLFVGALLLSIVFPMMEPATTPTGAFRWFTSKVSVLAVVGLIQALLAVVVVKYALGMETINTPLFILTAIITSYTFIAIVQMLVSIFGDPGRFMAILILILQLTTSAGTFPLELIPSQLKIFNTLLPMTYSVQAFKASISTGDMSHLWANNGVLIGFMVACLALTFGYFALVFKKRYSAKAATVEA
ncbi:YhgE/Pip domain-containing protein [Sporosarcina sp.]|uniref:YhgE/Pip domain-containing protein n=1 Tax=Sporosarcina sp. TaxID=49982 RepID=UPI002612E01E|nr:YhgE/Pip domain-containing protein [Sporosarcina sp.]